MEADNDGILGVAAKVRTAFTAIYSLHSKQLVSAELNRFQPHVVHVHNFFPTLTPSVFYSCVGAGVPVVQTLHNYRLLCPAAVLYRNGHVCESCVGKTFQWPGVLHGCYRESRKGTLAVAAMNAAHHLAGTWNRAVDMYISLTEFGRGKYIAAGMPPDKIVVKGHFLDVDPGAGTGDQQCVVYVGRLSAEKGIDTLLRAWQLPGAQIPLKIIGAGPLEDECRNASASNPWIEYLGPMRPAEVYEWMGRAQALMLPSNCYEGFPRTIVEAFAKGTPAIASGHGAMLEAVEHGRTGLHFKPGDAQSLITQVEWMLEHPEKWREMRSNARTEYETRHSANSNYFQLMDIYRRAMAAKKGLHVALNPITQ